MQTDREFSSVVQLPQFPGPSVVTRYNASEDPDTSTAETVQLMTAAAIADSRSPQVWLATKAALGNGVQSQEQICRRIYDWIACRIQFRSDDPVLHSLLGLDNELDMLIRPARLLTMQRPAEDCDGFTMLACSMLLSAGVPCEIVTIKADPQEPERFSHVYCQALLEDGSELVMDCSQAAQHGFPIGWEAPDYFDRKAWGVIQPQQQEKGMHGLIGLGQGCSDTDPACSSDLGIPGVGGAPGIDLGTVPVSNVPPGFAVNPTTGDIYNITTGAILGTPAAGVVYGSTPGSGAGINWTQLATVLGADAAQITKLATLPSGYTLNAAGQPVLASTAGLSSVLSSPLLLLLGGGILLFALVGGKK
jgi:hypothetical protein